MHIKRNHPLFAEWSPTGMVILSPKDCRTKLRVGRNVLDIVNGLSDWTPFQEVIASFPDAWEGTRQDMTNVLKTLIEHEVLVERAHAEAGSMHSPWDKWGSVAMLYHRHSRDAPYITDLGTKREYLKHVMSAPPPTTTKNYPEHPRLHLPRNRELLSASFEDVLFKRRTHREFTDHPVSLDNLSTLLQATFAPQRFADGEGFGTLHLRTSPNAGARHEIESYVVVFNVADVPAGLYHYDSMEHSLELLSSDVTRAEISGLLYEQPMIETAPLILFTTAVTERIAHKYQDGRAYRLWLYNVGHVGQTFVLTATALGLGAFQTAAFRDSATDALLGVDGHEEFATYVLGCGHVSALESPVDIFPPPPR